MNVDFLIRIMDAAAIHRWNDHLCPIQLSELDKQAHKFQIAYVIATMEKNVRGKEIDWEFLIDCIVFEFLRSIALTDIKRPVMAELVKKEQKQIDDYVLKVFEPLIDDNAPIKERLQQLVHKYNPTSFEGKIARVASNMATYWEYTLIMPMNSGIHNTAAIFSNLKGSLEDYIEFLAVERFLQQQKPYGFINLCGQLRFQTRWSRAPRIPATSVLGHLAISAIIIYFLLDEINSTPARKRNGFFGAVFHDLLEVLTRDIIAPVKKAVPQIDEFVKDYEKEQLTDHLLPLLPPSMRAEIEFFVIDEFENKIMLSTGSIKKKISNDQAEKEFNSQDNPYDGSLIQCVDHLAAYIEAMTSLQLGIKSKHVIEGKQSLEKLYKDKIIYGINIGDIYKQLLNRISNFK
jgi:putative hydrolase of HD superfamily